MDTFRRRNNKNREYSGYNQASPQLRNRLLRAVSGYIGMPPEYDYGLNEFRGINKDILNYTIDEEYGTFGSDYSRILLDGAAEDVFTIIEIIVSEGYKHLGSYHYKEMLLTLVKAFTLSGSVYEINTSGQIVLKLDEQVNIDISDAMTTINEYEEAKNKYQEAINKLVARYPSEEVVQAAHLALEKLVKAKSGMSGKGGFDKGINRLLAGRGAQIEFVRKLKGFKGNAKNISHDGNHVLDERDAIWYVRTIGAIFSLIVSD